MIFGTNHGESTIYSSCLQLVSLSCWRSHSRAVVYHSLHRVQIYTILCLYLVNLALLHYSLCCTIEEVFLFSPGKCYLPPSSASAITDNLSLAPTRSIHTFSHH